MKKELVFDRHLTAGHRIVAKIRVQEMIQAEITCDERVMK